jgi:predicted DsbA family dithiol-disulfide isomerase
VEWLPYFLRPDMPDTGWELPERYRAMNRDPHSPLRARFSAAGLKWKGRDWIPSTRRAHEATEYARARGKLEPFHAAVLRRYWDDAEDISSWPVLRAAAADAGLDGDDLERSVGAGEYTETVKAITTEAMEIGVTGVPTFLLAGRYAVVGAQEYSVFEQVMAKLKVPHRTA